MELAFNANTARIAGNTLSDGSIAYGVDLLDQVGSDLGEEYVHIPCRTKDHAWRVLTHLIGGDGDLSLGDEVLRPYE